MQAVVCLYSSLAALDKLKSSNRTGNYAIIYIYTFDRKLPFVVIEYLGTLGSRLLGPTCFRLPSHLSSLEQSGLFFYGYTVYPFSHVAMSY